MKLKLAVERKNISSVRELKQKELDCMWVINVWCGSVSWQTSLQISNTSATLFTAVCLWLHFQASYTVCMSKLISTGKTTNQTWFSAFSFCMFNTIFLCYSKLMHITFFTDWNVSDRWLKTMMYWILFPHWTSWRRKLRTAVIILTVYYIKWSLRELVNRRNQRNLYISINKT